ncbi:WecB/TagA/CpsF family glycosyltransferase [Salinimicrobium sp. TH3]|uniref:WecB/TagA/CpsF family glycosyltransferase n=1 Tax=Salinimicrobium sp. TH3 TaxID=2997342 RepID=UPI0022753F6B|nr:WecB/TagA/CpsF family glycosyltransferase [Salinimicrobium sp. TH3]MCY2687777.1 WecB/TagA/CpsF family glycosyltransferase [Salinimicrobium sp. TH3]
MIITTAPQLKKKDFIAFDISLGTYAEFVSEVIEMAESRTSAYTCVANVHMLVEAYRDPLFANIVKQAHLVSPDGMPLAKGLKLLYGLDQERIAGMDLLPDLLAASEEKNIPVYFYGGTEEMLQETEKFCREEYPGLSIAGSYSPPFRELDEREDAEVVERINGSGAALLFVALGCPKQEKWMAAMKGRIDAAMIGIGGALPVMIGLQKRAPLWMQRFALEWFFRLCQEPRRLFKRYAVTNNYFLYLLLKTWLKRKELN